MMTKRVLQDVVTSSRPRPSRSVRKSNTAPQRDSDPAADVRMPSASRARVSTSGGSGRGFSRFAIWGVAVGAVVFLLFVLLSFFSGTVVEVIPLQKNVTVSGDFVAYKEAVEGDLPFKLVVLEHSISGEVTATGEKEVERKASGDIVIFNAYSSNSQKLIKRTRFETPDGKIYRIDKSVVVPGTTVQNGKIVPGSVEATVYADIPGEEYNIDLSDFTIPGFKGDPRFDKFYGRSKTPIEDGFSGVVKIASTEDVAEVKEELQNSLKETLLEQARAQVPGDFILYDDAVFFLFEDIDSLTETKKNTIDITEKGILYGVLFNKSEFSKHIAENSIATYDGSDVFAYGLEELEFSVNNREGFDPMENTEFGFTVSGSVVVVWDIDETALARDLVGISKTVFLSVIEEYSNIQKAEAILRPFWKSEFPESSEDITIRKIDHTPAI